MWCFSGRVFLWHYDRRASTAQHARTVICVALLPVLLKYAWSGIFYHTYISTLPWGAGPCCCLSSSPLSHHRAESHVFAAPGGACPEPRPASLRSTQRCLERDERQELPSVGGSSGSPLSLFLLPSCKTANSEKRPLGEPLTSPVKHL